MSAIVMIMALWGGPAGAYAPPGILESFSPTGVVPGQWTLSAPSQTFQLTVGTDGHCDGRVRVWSRPDQVRLVFRWAACGEREIDTLLDMDGLERLRQPPEKRTLSVLPGRADLVFGPAEGWVIRAWVQGGYRIDLATHCSGASADTCAELTAPAARLVADQMPGEPRVSEKALFVGSQQLFAGLIAGALVLWLMIVGGRMLQNAATERLSGNPSDRRLVNVDEPAQQLRAAARHLRFGHVLLCLGLTIALFIVPPAVRGDATPAVLVGIVALVPVAGGVFLTRRWRHPLLAAAWLRRPVRLGLPRPRRLLSAALTVTLALFAVSLPLLSLGGVLLASLVGSSTQEVGRLFIGCLIIAVAIGYAVDRMARRVRALDINQSREVDQRAHIVYLRNFADDDFRIPTTALSRQGPWQILTGWLDPVRRSPFEELMVRALWRYGPVYALTHPKARLATLGAAKTTIPVGMPWEQFVERSAQEALAVVVSATPSQLNDGLRWELQMLAERLCHGRIVLVLGPRPRKELLSTFRSLVAEVAGHPLFRTLAAPWVSEDTHVLVHIPNQGRGTWYGWKASRRTAWSYATALDEALAWSTVQWQQPPAELSSLDKDVISETVRRAVDHAVASSTPQPVDTRSLLLALMHVDTSGRWDRIWLHTRSLSEVARADTRDRTTEPAGSWKGVAFTGSSARAVRIAHQVSRSFDLGAVPAGVFALGLIADPESAASRALGITNPTEHQALVALVQDDLLGTTLRHVDLASDGAVRPTPNARIAFGTAGAVRAAPPGPPAAASFPAAAGHHNPAVPAATRPFKPKMAIYAALVVALLGWGSASAIAEATDTVVAPALASLFWIVVIEPFVLYAIVQKTRHARLMIVGCVLVTLIGPAIAIFR